MSDEEKCGKTMASQYRIGHTHTCRTKAHSEGFCLCACGTLFSVST